MTRPLLHKLSRHAEYYNVSSEFDKLYEFASKGYKFNKLYDLIFSSKNIRLAYRNIKRNKGSTTPGCDKLTIRHLQHLSITKLLNTIKAMAINFKPSEVRRVWIPKPNGKRRPIGIPSLKDRLLQQCIKQILEPICEAHFHKHSYGFRPCRSTKHALARSMFLINKAKLHHVVDIDIKEFFSTIHHGKLLKQLWTIGIRDKRIISILSKMLKAEITGEGIPKIGTPQGGILSPLLSNVTLNELDWWLSNQWESFTSKKKYAEKNSMQRALKKTKLKEFYIVRYADDFKIFCRDHQTAVKIFAATSQWLKTRLHLEISLEKSTITNLRKKSSPFLGIKLRVQKTGKKLVCFSRILPKSLESMKTQLKKLVKNIQMKPCSTTVNHYNAAVLGFQEYYNSATHCTIDFAWLGYILDKIIHNRLKNLITREGPISNFYKKKYRRKLNSRFIAGIPLFPIADIRHNSPMCFSPDHTPYTESGRHKIHKELNTITKNALRLISVEPLYDQSIEFNDNRISKWVASQGKCNLTREYLGHVFHCHHLIPRCLGGTDAYNNLVILSPDAHKLIHAKDPALQMKLLNMLELNGHQLRKLNKLRELVGNESLTKK